LVNSNRGEESVNIMLDLFEKVGNEYVMFCQGSYTSRFSKDNQ